MPPSSSPRTFQDRLAVEMLTGERVRTGLLAALFGIILVGTVLNTAFRFTGDLPQVGTTAPDNFVVAVAAAYLVYELSMYWFISRRLREKRSVATWAWYLNALVETSSATIALYFIGVSGGDLDYALTSPLLILYFIVILLSVLRLSPAIGLFTGVVAGAQYLGLSLYLVDILQVPGEFSASFLSRFYVERSLFFVVSGVAAGLVAREIRRWMLNSFRSYEESRRILRMFGQYTSPEIADELLEHGWTIETQRQTVCIMFVDIRGFTAFAETRPPEEVVDYLNGLLEFMIEEVNDHHGSIHQLLGDGFMAVFGAPVPREDDVENAVAAARAILRRLESYTNLQELPPTRIGIGIHVGEAIVGPVGSSIHKEYKITGDVVNVAARLERLNKKFGSQILISRPVWERVRSTTQAEELGTVEIRGRSRPIEVFQVA